MDVVNQDEREAPGLPDDSHESRKPKKDWGLGLFRAKRTENEMDCVEDGSDEEWNENDLQSETKGSQSNISSSNSDHDTTTIQTSSPLHPPSPKSLSPQSSRVSLGSIKSKMVTETKDGIMECKSTGLSVLPQTDQSFESKGSPQSQMELLQKTAWYEEYIQEKLTRNDGDFAVLTNEELEVLEFLDYQRKPDSFVTDDQWSRLCILVREFQEEKTKMLELGDIDDEDLDTDRLYYLELISRIRNGETLDDDEQEEFDILKQKWNNHDCELLDLEEAPTASEPERRLDDFELEHTNDGRYSEPGFESFDDENAQSQNNEDDHITPEKNETNPFRDQKEKSFIDATISTESLTSDKSGGGDEGEGEIGFNSSATLIQQKEDESQINTQTIQEAMESIEGEQSNITKRNDSDIDDTNDDFDEKEFDELLSQKDRGEVVDEDRLYELELLYRLQCGENLTPNELKDLGLHRARRRAKSSQDNQSVCLVELKENNSDLTDDHGVSMFDEREFDDLLSQKERGEEVDENRLYELELMYRQQCGEVLSEEELIDLKLFRMQRVAIKKGEIGNDQHYFSEKVAIEKFHRELRRQGLPPAISFMPFDEQKSSAASTVSDGNYSYIKDLVYQRNNREENRKEECIEEAFKLYSRAIENENMTANEEMLLSIFGQVLSEKNEKMRDVDKNFDDLVEREVEKYESSKNEIKEKSIDAVDREFQGNENIAADIESTDHENIEVENITHDATCKRTIDLEPDNELGVSKCEKGTRRGWIEGFFRRTSKEEKSEGTTSKQVESNEHEHVEDGSSNLNEQGRKDADEIGKDENGENIFEECVGPSPCSNDGRTRQKVQNDPLENRNSESATSNDDSFYNELVERVNDGEILSEDHAYALELLEQVRNGKFLSDVEMEEVRMLREIRKEQINDWMEEPDDNFEQRAEKATRKQYSESNKMDLNADERNPYEEALLQRLERGEILDKTELEELKILQEMREQQGQSIGDEHEGPIDSSRASTSNDTEMKKITFDGFDHKEYSVLMDRKERGELNDNEEYELALLHRIIKGETLEEGEVEELEILRHLREHSDSSQLQIEGDSQRGDGSEHSSDTFFDQNEQDQVKIPDELHKEYSNAKVEAITEEGTKIHPVGVLDMAYAETGDHNKDSNHFETRGYRTSTIVESVDSPILLEKDLKLSGKEREGRQNIGLDSPNNYKELNKDLLQELYFVSQLRKGMELSDQEEYEFELLMLTREGKSLSQNQIADMEHFRREREDLMFETYLEDLFSSGASLESINVDIRYELSLSHNDLNGVALSEEEEVELCLFDQRREGQILTEDDLDELDLLKSKRANQEVFAIQSTQDQNLKVEDDDSIYRRDLQEKQRKGQRLGRKEFQWLQILMKKSRNEELDEDDLDELQIMRNSRVAKNDGEDEIVNTKKLLEEELRKQQKRKLRDQKRKEKEERREKRRLEREQRQKTKRMRRKKRIGRGANTGPSEKPPDSKTVYDDKKDGESTQFQEVQTEVNCLPPVSQHNESKEDPKRGVFGGVFGGKKRLRQQQQQLEEAKRLQEQLIKEQMKALALDNEVEELEREKVMQEQLVQETIYKIKADESDGSSSWETDTQYNTEEDEISSSSSSSSQYTDYESYSMESEREGNDVLSPMIYQASTEVEHSARKRRGRQSDDDDETDLVQSFRLSNNLSQTSEKSFNTQNSVGEIQNDKKDKNSYETYSRASGLGDSENSSRVKSLEFHLKKGKKRHGRRTKYGDDVSLGALHLNTPKGEAENGPRNQKARAITGKKHFNRPWVEDDLKQALRLKNLTRLNEKTPATDDNPQPLESTSSHFNRSFIAKIPEEDVEGDLDSVASFASDREDASDDEKSHESASNHEIRANDLETAGESLTSSMIDSLTHSLRSFGAEDYDLGLQEYENIESRLAGKLANARDHFDVTWENTVADENVIAQMNQRLRERQRAKESSKEKKKEKKEESRSLQDVPRLFLFEGEKAEAYNKRGRKKQNRRKKSKSQKKMDRTLTKEFRKAMREIFDSNSDDEFVDDEINVNGALSDDFEGFDTLHVKAARRQSIDDISIYGDLDSDGITLSDHDKPPVVAQESDDDSDVLGISYLERLQLRSMPKERKQNQDRRASMGTTTGFQTDTSDDDLKEAGFAARNRNHRRRRRKKDGEIAGDDIDPADIYHQELEKQLKGKKAFTVDDLKKEIEDMKKSTHDFADFDGMNLEPVKKTKKKKTKTTGLGSSALANNIGGLTDPHAFAPSASSQHSFGIYSSNQGLLGRSRRGVGNGVLVDRPSTVAEVVDEEDEAEGAILGGGIKSEEFGREMSIYQSSNESKTRFLPKLKHVGKSGLKNIRKTGVNSLKTIQMTFGGKKSVQSIGDGGLLNDDSNHEFDDRSRTGLDQDFVSVGGIGALSSQEPLPVPEPQEYDEVQPRRRGSVIKKMNTNFGISKNSISKWKMQGMGSNKYGSKLMMD